ncbi:LytR/AlgR family response regulator transcription factor [Geofilum rhodophaeum]|uniref:LytR/AlgR family response regulator transcription factor n=1 Tax=Geofilum rhodophaeum TaxID=1965019 RepID=UPI0013149935|nr:LytTR family DNA-binding domain-containing protein [Geofilum rhodophaeum]
MIRCIIVDDEPRAVDILRQYAARISFLEIEAACTDPIEAAALIKSRKPDLLFLDIEMPEVNGIQLARSAGRPPLVIFTTAYSKYAVEGFNLNAVDYLLKPFGFERFYQAIYRANEIIEARHDVSASNGPGDAFIIVNAEYQKIRILLADILFIESMDKYVRIHTSLRKIMTLMALKNLERMLPLEHFVRIHKSFIVPINRITSFNRQQIMLNEISLPVGRAYVDDLTKRLQ